MEAWESPEYGNATDKGQPGPGATLGRRHYKEDVKNSDPGFELEVSFFGINCFVEGMVAKISLRIN
jgi:hypothetical protein